MLFLWKANTTLTDKNFDFSSIFFSPKSLQKFAQYYMYSKLWNRLRSGTGCGFVSGRLSNKAHYFFRLLFDVSIRLIHDGFSFVWQCVNFRSFFLVQFSLNVNRFSVQLIALCLISNYDAFLVFLISNQILLPWKKTNKQKNTSKL